MNERTRGRRLGAAAWITVSTLALGTAVAAGGGAAGAATSHSGKLQVCVSSAKTQTARYTVHRSGWTKSFSLKSRAHHVACAHSLSVKQASYRVSQRTPSGVRVSSVSVSPTARRLSASAAAGWAKAKVASKHTTQVRFGNAVIAKAPVTPPPPTPTPPPGPPTDPGTGYLEVCKQAGDGFVAGNVTVNVSDGAYTSSQVVPVGQCTAPLAVPSGTATVSETTPAPYGLAMVKTSPTSALVSTDLAGNSTRVTVMPSTDGSTETLVTLVNATRLAQFKICKTLTGNSQDLIDGGHNAFTFDVSYQALNSAAYSTKVNVIVPTVGQAACVLYPIALPLGTKVTVTEENSSATTLTGVSVFPAAQDAGSSGRSAVFVLGPNANGITTATFVNRADGTVEICKNIDNNQWFKDWGSRMNQPPNGWSPYDGYVFHFSVNGGAAIAVQAGECSAPLTVPAGTATVQELATPNFNLEQFTATGPDGSNRIQSGTNPITVAVPAGGVGNETLVIATNRVQTGQVKVCKMLDGNVPVGKSYKFATTFWVGTHSFTEWTTLTPTGTGPDGEVCSYLSAPLPVIDPSGKPISFKTTEGASPFGLTSGGALIVEPTSITYDGNGVAAPSRVWKAGDPGSADGTYYGCAAIGQGVNVLTFTNSLVLDP